MENSSVRTTVSKEVKEVVAEEEEVELDEEKVAKEEEGRKRRRSHLQL